MATAFELIKQRIDEVEAKVNDWDLKRKIAIVNIPPDQDVTEMKSAGSSEIEMSKI